MNSIMKKLFLQIGLLIIILVSLFLLANTLLLERYYIYHQKNKLIDYYQTINNFSSAIYEDNILDIMRIENASNVNIFIENATGKLLYASNDNRKPPKEKLDVIKKEEINNQMSFLWVTDQIPEQKNLMLRGTLENGNYIELVIPLASIQTNIELTNTFYLIIGGFVFLISMVFAYMISNYFTKPIREMNDATNRMKSLDFNTSCKVVSKDEIGQLAVSINEMQKELSINMGILNERNQELEKEIREKIRLDEKRRALLNNVSHELKTPLALMQGYAEGLKVNVIQGKEKANFYCDVIIDESKKMNQLVESLLNIDAMEFGDKVLCKSRFEINQFIRQEIIPYEKLFNEQHITYTLNEIEPKEVFADSFMIKSVFTNYITNAIHYVDERKIVEVHILQKKNCVRIEVYNTANPISAKDMDKLWDSFYKLDKARTREKGGHGLGLSIVKAIQEAHQSGYGVKNMKDGVCFWFDINY